MELQITGQNLELSPAVRRRIERKMDRLNRHLPDITTSKLEIVEEKTKSPEQRYLVRMMLDSSGAVLRSEERGKDLFTAIDKAAETMDRQISDHKGKRQNKGRGNSLARGKTAGEPEAEPIRRVVRVKRFVVKPMPVTEAVEQMEALKHDFFLFFNDETEELNLLYRRRDGNYGLIEPELD
jgi:putative sigma-54 modulation protein